MTTADRVVIYRDRGRRWRWRAVAGNNRIIADSSYSYRWRSSALRAARRTYRKADVDIRVEGR